LAQIQATLVVEKLRRAMPDQPFAIVPVRTQGDADQKSSLKILGGAGVFVKELEAALQRREIDLAVHSAKDLPSVLPDEFILAAVPQRDTVEDVLISSLGATLEQLPAGARLATGSPRRRALVLSQRPDLNLVDIRGNVDTRLRKLHEGQFEALILARAALIRLGLENEITEILSPKLFVPAPGQGVLAIESRSGDSFMLDVAAKIDSSRDRACLMAERRFLAVLEAGCSTPIGAWARWEMGQLTMDAVILDLEGRKALRASGQTSRSEEAEILGENLAQELLSCGAEELIHRGD
jgi:hydroxymethylbilane synthase